MHIQIWIYIHVYACIYIYIHTCTQHLTRCWETMYTCAHVYTPIAQNNGHTKHKAAQRQVMLKQHQIRRWQNGTRVILWATHGSSWATKMLTRPPRRCRKNWMVCVCVCLGVYMCVFTYIFYVTLMCVHIFMYVYIYIYIYIHANIYVYIHIHIYIYTYLYVYIWIYMYIYVYVYI